MTGAVSMQCGPRSGPSGGHMMPCELVQMHLTLNTMSCSHHLAFVCPTGKLLNKSSHLRVAYICSSGTILRPSTGMALNWFSFVCGSGTIFVRNSKFRIRMAI